jgi:putative ABC transport system permease protein
VKTGTYVFMAAEALALNKVRSALTMLGMVIGVLAVIVMVGLGQASQAYITDQVKGLGAGLLIVTPGNPKTQMPFGPPGTYTPQTLKPADVRALDDLPGTRLVAPHTLLQESLAFGRRTSGGMLIGTNEQAFELRGWTLAAGRAFSAQEARTGARVMVIGEKLRRDLFRDFAGDPVGAKIEVRGQRFRVIGVLTDQGAGIFGGSNQAVMPARAVQALLGGVDRINSIMIKAEREEGVPLLEAQVKALLRQRHAIRPSEEDDFKLQTQADLLATVTTITRVFTALLAGIAAISLLVGGIGIMNIMLVTVTERTREIGVRKALGAKRRDILGQFLVESAGLSLAGGLVGMALGIGLTWGVTRATGMPFVVSAPAVLGGAAFSIAVGVFFGLYPAYKAAGLAPVDALRYE